MQKTLKEIFPVSFFPCIHFSKQTSLMNINVSLYANINTNEFSLHFLSAPLEVTNESTMAAAAKLTISSEKDAH